MSDGCVSEQDSVVLGTYHCLHMAAVPMGCGTKQSPSRLAHHPAKRRHMRSQPGQHTSLDVEKRHARREKCACCWEM